MKVAMVINPTLLLLQHSGILKQEVSNITPKEISAKPIGSAVCETFSLTLKAVKRTKQFESIPSEARKTIVLRKFGLEER
jgi:hypothetical protein